MLYVYIIGIHFFVAFMVAVICNTLEFSEDNAKIGVFSFFWELTLPVYFMFGFFAIVFCIIPKFIGKLVNKLLGRKPANDYYNDYYDNYQDCDDFK